MKKPLVTMLLVFGTVVLPALPAAAQEAQPAAGAGQSQPAQQKKEIKDPAEYNAYVNAVQQQDPKLKASGLEAFLKSYPNTVMKEEANEQLMAAYQQAGDAQKASQAANQLIQVNPNNVRGLALLAYNARTCAEQGNAACIPQARQYGTQGIQAVQTMPKPEGMSDEDFAKQKNQFAAVFEGAAGFAALQQKDYPSAASHLRAAVAALDALKPPAGPQTDALFLRDVYPLAVSDLEQKPAAEEGLWWVARAGNLAAGNAAAQAQIEKYGKSKYIKFHGTDEGWAELKAAATVNMPPADRKPVAKYEPPTPQQQAADLIKEKKVKDMGFAEWQLILSSGNQSAADIVWNTINGKALQLVAAVISATPTKIELAGSTDDIESKTADITMTMETALPARFVPKPGEMITFEAVPSAYTPTPFMMTMKDGILLDSHGQPLKTTAPVRRPAPRRRPQ